MVALLPPSWARAEAPPTAQLRGVQLHSLWSANTSADVAQQLDLVASSGSTIARLDVAWSSLMVSARGQIEPSYAKRLDDVVAGAAARGIRLLLVVSETPCWASSAPDSLKLNCTTDWWNRKVTKYAPTDPADYAWVMSWLASRYGSKLAGLEVWNEPNYDDGSYFTFQAPDKALAYTRLVQATYPAVKAAAPNLPVVAGALSFSDDVFLRALYANGIRGSYDVLSTHPYNEGRAPGAPHDSRWYKYDLVQGTDAIRAARAAAGDTTPLWFTEFGYTACTVGADAWCVTPEQQATYLADAAKLVAGWSDVGAFLVYNLRDKGTTATSTEDNFGLVTQGYTKKPSYDALAQAFRALAAPTPVPSQSPSPSPSVTAGTALATDPATTVEYPAVSSVRGRLLDDSGQPLAGRTVAVLQRPMGTTTWAVRTVTSGADGGVSASGTAVSTDWQLRFDGDPGLAASLGVVTNAPVATALSLAASAASVGYGSFLTLSGPVAPDHAGQAVYVERLTSSGWVDVTSSTLTSASTFSLKFKQRTRGTLSYRVRKAADGNHAQGISNTVAVTVV